MRKNDAFVAKIVITRLTKAFMAMFAPAESLPSPATLVDCGVQQESCKYKCFHIFPISIDQRYWKEHLTFEDFHISKKIPKAKSYQMHHGLISSFF